MCICEKLGNTVRLDHTSVRKLHGATARIIRREHIDGEDIILVRAYSSPGHWYHEVLCPGDVLYRKKHRESEGEQETYIVHGFDSYQCPRKKKFRALVRRDIVIDENIAAMNSPAAVMHLHELVQRGVYIGTFTARWLYVAEVAEFLSLARPDADGIGDAPTYLPFAERALRYAHSRDLYASCAVLSSEKIFGTQDTEGNIVFPSLTRDEVLLLAFYDDTKSLVEQLIEEGKLSLMGEVLISPLPHEVPDSERVQLPVDSARLLASIAANGFVAQVQQHHDPYRATFCVFEEGSGGLVFSRQVPVMHGAMCGPDVDDLAAWEEFLDEFLQKEKGL